MTPKGVCVPLGGEERHLVADLHAEGLGQLLADRQPGVVVETVERPLPDIALDAGQALEVGLRDAAHQGAGLLLLRGNAGRVLDHGKGEGDAGNFFQIVRDFAVIGQGRVDRLDENMAVDADQLGNHLVAHAVHHRHDDDQGHHPDRDAGDGEPGDRRRQPAAPARAHVAQGQHALIGAEGRGARLGPARPFAGSREKAQEMRHEAPY